MIKYRNLPPIFWPNHTMRLLFTPIAILKDRLSSVSADADKSLSLWLDAHLDTTHAPTWLRCRLWLARLLTQAPNSEPEAKTPDVAPLSASQIGAVAALAACQGKQISDQRLSVGCSETDCSHDDQTDREQAERPQRSENLADRPRGQGPQLHTDTGSSDLSLFTAESRDANTDGQE